MKKYKKSKLISVWSLSYFLLLGLFVISIVSVSLVSQLVNKKINSKYCQTLFGGISQNVTETVEKSNLLYSTLINYENVEKILFRESTDAYYNVASVSALLDDLRAVKGNVDFYIYLPETDTVLADNGVFKSSDYYKTKMNEYGISYDEWMKNFHRENAKGMVFATNADDGDIFLHEKYLSKDGKRMYFISKINESVLLDVDGLPEWISDSDIYISNLSGDIYMSRGNSERIEKCTNISAVDEVYNDKWEVFSKTESSLLPIDVTIVYPKGAAWTELNFLIKLQIFMCVAVVLISLGIIIFVIRRNYRPIVSIMKMLNTEENSANELDGIQRRIHEILSMNKYYIKQAEKYAGEKQQNILSKCLEGNYSPAAVIKMLKDGNVEFKYKYFTLSIFDIKDLSVLFEGDDEGLSDEQKFRELIFIFHNIFTELFQQHECEVKITAVDERIVAIVDMEDSTPLDMGTVYEVLKYGLDFVHQNFGIETGFVLTRLYSSIGALPESYAQGLYLLRYKKSMGIDVPVTVNDVEYGSEERADIVLDGDTEQKLIQCIAGGNFENAQMLLEHIFRNLSGMKLSLDQRQCMMIDLGCILSKVPQNEVEVDFGKILDYSANVSAMQEFLRTSIKEMCERSRITVNKTGKIDQVKEYIDTKYYEEMDLNGLSFMFHISQNYLSASFKKEVGMPITDYINTVRVKYAKQFLKNTEKSVKDIAEKVGYKNIRTFNRVFQKYEGIAPTVYRNNIR